MAPKEAKFSGSIIYYRIDVRLLPLYVARRHKLVGIIQQLCHIAGILIYKYTILQAYRYPDLQTYIDGLYISSISIETNTNNNTTLAVMFFGKFIISLVVTFTSISIQTSGPLPETSLTPPTFSAGLADIAMIFLYNIL